jgi:hypothetical protein
MSVPRGSFGLLAEGGRDGRAIGGTDILSGVESEGRGYMQQMQFRALLAGDERRAQHGAVCITGKISGGDDGGHGRALLVVAYDGNVESGLAWAGLHWMAYAAGIASMHEMTWPQGGRCC